VLKHI